MERTRTEKMTLTVIMMTMITRTMMLTNKMTKMIIMVIMNVGEETVRGLKDTLQLD